MRMIKLLMFGLLLAACGGGGDSPRFLSLGTAPPGGAFFVVGSALAEVLNESSQSEGWSFTAEATKGTQENIRRLTRGELDLALANASISYFAVRGQAGWEQPFPIRSVMTLAPNVALFVTPASSDIESIADLKGRRVVVGPAGAGFEYFLRPLLSSHGVSFADFTPLNNTQTGAAEMLGDGSAAAAFLGGVVPTASITQVASSMEVRFVPFGESEMEQLVTTYPFFERATIPAGTYPGQEDAFEGLNVGSMHLITSAEADEDLVYRLTRTLYQNRESLSAKHPVGKAVNPSNAVKDTGTEFHPGAIRFYREIDIWPGE